MSSLPAFPTSEDDLPVLTISVDWVRGAVVLCGELDRESAHHLVDVVTSLAATGHPRWLVDTADVSWCDAAGLRALATAHALAVECGGELRLARTSRCVDRLVTMSGLGDRIARASTRSGRTAGRAPLRLAPTPPD
jgi:anti-sigma B factor antagonist